MATTIKNGAQAERFKRARVFYTSGKDRYLSRFKNK